MIPLLLALLVGDPSWRTLGGRAAERAILDAWEEADAQERIEMRSLLMDVETSRLFMDARPVLLPVGEELLTPAEVIARFVAPALEPVEYDGEQAADPGAESPWTEEHGRARAALAALRDAYAPPRLVGAGALRLFLTLIDSIADAPGLDTGVRLRLLLDAIALLRAAEERAAPDARARWLLREEVVPAIAALAAEWRGDKRWGPLAAEAAAQLYLPSLLDAGSLDRLAEASGSGAAREPALLRSLRRGALDANERIAFARSVCALAADDASFCAGAAPLFLELLADEALPQPERAAIVAVVLDRLAVFPPLRPTALDLLSVAFGAEQRDLAAAAAMRGSVPPAPPASPPARLLQVLLLRQPATGSVYVVRVVRRDVPPFRPVHFEDRAGERRFLGVLLPSDRGLELVGPPPGFLAPQETRLLRRPVSRASVAIFGTEREEIELSLVLPEGGAEPIDPEAPTRAALAALLEARLAAGPSPEERKDLVRLLVRLESREARALALAGAADPASLAELLPLAERGDREAAAALAARLGDLDPALLPRLFAALGAIGDPALLAPVGEACAEGPPATACAAAQALLGEGDASGVLALLGRREAAVRAFGAGLALRCTPLAGGMRVTPRAPPLALQVAGAFRKEDGPAWTRFGAWLRKAFDDPEEVKRLRRNHAPLQYGEDRITATGFVQSCLKDLRKGRFTTNDLCALILELLGPVDPGRGIPAEHLGRLLDAVAERALADEKAGRFWRDSLLLLACAQNGIETGREFGEMARARLAAIPGAPPREAPLAAVVAWAAR